MWNYGTKGSQKTGKLGEDIACTFLKKKGFSILERNYREDWGEIDIIAKKGGELHFIEVKTEKKSGAQNVGSHRPEEKVDARKITKLTRVIDTYLGRNGRGREWQIDIVSVVLDEEDKQAHCNIIENVF
jgi:putative endonuclease